MSNFKNPVISVVTNKLSSALMFDSVGRGRLTVWGNQDTGFNFDITSALKPGALQEFMQLVDRGDLALSVGFLDVAGSTEYTYTGALCAVEDNALGTPANEQQPSVKAAAGFSGKEMADFYTKLPGISVKSDAPKAPQEDVPTQAPQETDQAPQGATQAPQGATQAPQGATQAPAEDAPAADGEPQGEDAQSQHDAALAALNGTPEAEDAQGTASEESKLDALFDLDGGTKDLVPDATPVAEETKTVKAPAAPKAKSKKVSK